MMEDEMTDYDNDYPFEGTNSPRGGVHEPPDSDYEDDFELSNSKTDTSASETRNGKDMQGIPWERFDFTRDHYRETRCQHYKNYESLPRAEGGLVKECKLVEMGHSYYNFHFNTRILKPTVVHFQVDKCVFSGSRRHLVDI